MERKIHALLKGDVVNYVNGKSVIKVIVKGTSKTFLENGHYRVHSLNSSFNDGEDFIVHESKLFSIHGDGFAQHSLISEE
jgi:hypothetical protein